MKLVICLVLSYVCLISAKYVQNEHIFGIVSRGQIMGTKDVQAEMPLTNHMEYTKYEFTFPEVRKCKKIIYYNEH